MEPTIEYLLKKALADGGCLPLDVQQLNILVNVAVPLIEADNKSRIEYLARECAMLRNQIDAVWKAADDAKTAAIHF